MFATLVSILFWNNKNARHKYCNVFYVFLYFNDLYFWCIYKVSSRIDKSKGVFTVLFRISSDFTNWNQVFHIGTPRHNSAPVPFVCMYVSGEWWVNVFLDTCTTITTTRRTGSSRLTTTPTLWWRTFATCCSPTTPASPYFSAASSSPTWSRATWAAELVMFYRRRPFVASPQKVKTENLYEESK